MSPNGRAPLTFFWAYPSEPPQVGQTIEAAAERLRAATNSTVETWRQIDTPGRFLIEGILEKIDSADALVADITRLNFNVTFEVGYAIGRKKRILLTVNSGLSPDTRELSQLGIYDTLGYREYENSDDLFHLVAGCKDTTPIDFPEVDLDRGAPIFVLDTLYKNDASIRILSKIKKSRIRYRSFDPKEQSRLSTLDAFRSVASSVAIVVNFLSPEATDSRYNNLRGALLAGLAYALEQRYPLLLQEGDSPVPIDYRDFVAAYKHPRDVDQHIDELIPRVTEALQKTSTARAVDSRSLLARLDLGDPAAENETTNLGEYYVQTDEFRKVLSGNVRIAVGRKGAGKTALFFQVRDSLRQSRQNVVLDLKPEGHQLKRFRQAVIEQLDEAVQEHVAAAFWEYVLLLEICHKLLEKDRQSHVRDHTIYEQYQNLALLYSRDELTGDDADFSERMLRLVHRLSDEFGDKKGKAHLTAGEVTELVFKQDIPVLRDQLVSYLQRKDTLVVLFDNIDKGWPTRGISNEDIVILRGLLEASRKLEKLFRSRNIPVVFTVFLRNDVYEFLVSETPDRGKEARVLLDWTDPDLLREVLRRRLVFNGIPEESSFEEGWRQVAVSHVAGEESSDYLVSHSLMRPRNLLRLVEYAKSAAVNLDHPRISEDDLRKATASFSADLVNEISLEIRDVFPAAEDLLYYFIGAPEFLSSRGLRDILEKTPLTKVEYEPIVDILLWFAVLGVLKPSESSVQPTFIYDVYYDIKKLKFFSLGKNPDEPQYCIHRAFWPVLEITPAPR